MSRVLLQLALALLVLGACKPREEKNIEDKKGPGKGDQLALVPNAPGGEVKVGLYGSLTGAEASFGTATENGVKLAIEEINAAGGIKSKGGTKIVIVSDDDQGKPEEVVTVVKKQINNDKVVALIGEVASSLSLAAGPIAQEAGIPMVSPSSTNPEVTKKGPYIFRVCFIDPFQGKVMATFASKTLNAKKAAIFTDVKSDYAKGLAQFFKEAFVAAGGQIVAEESYQKGDPDFKGQLGRLQAAAPEVLFIPGYYSDVAVIAKQSKEIGLKATLLGGDGWDSPELTKIGGDAIEGAYFSNHYSVDDQDPKVQEFVKTYQAKFGMVPDGLAALGYDAAKILADAMERGASLKPSDIRTALAETKDFKGVTGVITIDAERNASKPATVLQIQGGKYAFKEKINP
jgi:branched-chain amino acid transport system substrate-binding protein